MCVYACAHTQAQAHMCIHVQQTLQDPMEEVDLKDEWDLVGRGQNLGKTELSIFIPDYYVSSTSTDESLRLWDQGDV